MVLLQVYNSVNKGFAQRANGTIYEEFSRSVRDSCVLILDFSYAVRKHITGGRVSKLVHALKDIIGSLNRDFEVKTTEIRN